MDTEIEPKNKFVTYLLYISMSCCLTSALNIVHTLYALKIEFTAISFITPTLAGIVFGLMLAHIKLLSSKLRGMAYTDALTHIYNRLHFSHFLEAEIDKAKRYGGKFSIIFFDLDNFKDVNDNFGHMIGDDVLECVTDIVSKANRSADIFARYGGEEFVILTPETDIHGAAIHAERLRNDIEQHEFKKAGHITSSFGITEFNADFDTPESILQRADDALYMAKNNGRNRVEKS